MSGVRLKMPRVVTATTLLTVAVLAAGCGQGSTGTGTGGSVTSTQSGEPSGGGTSGGTGNTSGDPQPGPADLTIVVGDGSGHTTTWHLTCEPAGGDHPTPAKACAALAEHGRTALPPVPTDRMCTEIFGGPQTARITGTWRGERVDAKLSRGNGCEIARWQALIGLLPSPEA
jgi:hypothetical protein